MEDVLKFLLIAGVIIIGIAKQYKKEADKNVSKKPVMPMPEVEPTPVTMQEEIAERRITNAYKSHLNHASPQRATASSKTVVPQPSVEETSEFSIHSTEEARRAIIWSEIFQRKY